MQYIGSSTNLIQKYPVMAILGRQRDYIAN